MSNTSSQTVASQANYMYWRRYRLVVSLVISEQDSMLVTSPVYETSSTGPRTESWGTLQFTRMALESFASAWNICITQIIWNSIISAHLSMIQEPAAVWRGRKCRTTNGRHCQCHRSEDSCRQFYWHSLGVSAHRRSYQVMRSNAVRARSSWCHTALQVVFRSVVVAKLMYASSAWFAFASKTESTASRRVLETK